MRVEYSEVAVKQLKKLPKDRQIKILAKIGQLKNNPYAGKKLKGEFEGLFSLKVWPYRIIYRWLAQEKLLFINVIQHRQEVYQNLKPSTETISLRLPKYLPARIKELANLKDVPYQSLMKIFLAERVEKELKSRK